MCLETVENTSFLDRTIFLLKSKISISVEKMITRTRVLNTGLSDFYYNMHPRSFEGFCGLAFDAAASCCKS